MASRRRWRVLLSTGARPLTLMSVAIPLLLFLIASWYDRGVVLETQRNRLAATVEALADHVEVVLQTAALAVDLELREIQGRSWAEIGQSPDVHRFLDELNASLPQVEGAFLVDPSGHEAASSRNTPMATPLPLSNYAFVTPDSLGQLLISVPYAQGKAGGAGFAVARLRRVDGQPDGLAGVEISTAYFRSVLASFLAPHESTAAALVRDDGLELFRYPAPIAHGFHLAPSSPTMRAARRGPGLQEFRGVSVSDGRVKIGAVRRIPGWNLIVSYGIDERQILGAWYEHVAIFAAFALASMAVLLATARRVIRAEAERGRAEAALQESSKLEALGRLTGGVAHDFNNLLAAILGSLELALLRVSDAKIERHLTVARQAAQRGAKLTAQMLAFARKHAIDPRPVDVNAVVRNSDELIGQTCGAGVRVEYELRDGVWPALADPVQLELGLLNLLANARDAMPRGGVARIATRNVAAGPKPPAGLANGDYVAITVADTGEGMPEEVRRRVFEPFFTTKPPGKGTGLGLSMVFGFARQLGGAVAIDTAPGAGTAITLYLPRSRDAAATFRPREASPAELPVASRRALRVLVADDEAAVRDATSELLRLAGHEVVEAASGAEALAGIRGGEAIDLLLVDFLMPEMNGSVLVEQARRLRPGLPVLVMTGTVDHSGLRNLRASGIPVLEKPFDGARLLAALNDAAEPSIPPPAAAPVRPRSPVSGGGA